MQTNENTKKTTVKIQDYVYFPDQEIGRGAFATVYSGKNVSSDSPVAVKKIKISELQNRLNKLWSEIKIMKKLAHPHIIKLYDIHLDLEDEALYMILEFCNGGDLSDYVKKKILPESTILSYFTQIRDGLEYLHSFQVLHRDLKPQNILIHDNQIKICDFGLSTLADQNTLISTMCGSPLYMAPEIIQHETYTIKSDLWSLGVILYELFYHKHPYESSNYYELTQKIKQDIQFPLNSRVSTTARALLKELLQKNHETRLDWTEFFNHSWFSSNAGQTKSCDELDKDAGRIQLSTDSEGAEIFKFSNDASNNDYNELKDSLYYSCEESDPREMDGLDGHNGSCRDNRGLVRRSFVDTDAWMGSGRDRIKQKEKQIGGDRPKKMGLSQYIVKDYQKPGNHPMRSATYTPHPKQVAQSAPARSENWGNLGTSPNQSGYNSVGSKFYKYMYKSYSVVKNSFES